jgi:tetratricopeptide (TPR) repeat protein
MKYLHIALTAWACLMLVVPASGESLSVTPQLPSLAESATLLKRGLELSRRERNPQAEDMVRRSLDALQVLLPANDPQMAAAFDIAGRVFYNNDDYATSETYFRKALAIYSMTSGPTSLNASLQLGNIAAALREQRRYRDAEQLSLNSLKLRRAAVAADSPYLAGGYDNLGRTYLATGRYISAQNMFRQSRDIIAPHVNSDAPAIRRERDMLTFAVRKQNELVRGNTILFLSPVLVAILALLTEVPAIRGTPALKQAINLITVVAAYAFKGFATYFGAFVLMPFLMWILPSPLDATEIKPVAMLIGGASGLGAITAFEALLNWIRRAITPILG